LRVIHLISGGDTGGAKTHVLSLLSGLNKEITADLVCFMSGPFSREAEQLGIPLTVYESGFTASLHKVRKQISEGNYDLIHCHGSRANLMASIIRKELHIPVVCTVHSDYKLDYMGRPGAALTYGNLNAYAIRSIDYLVCVSDRMRGTLISRGFNPNRLFAIYNGIDFSVQVEKTDRQKYFSRIGCPFSETDTVVGIAARLDPVKDIPTLIKGFAEAHRSRPELKLLIAGDGQEADALKALTADLNVEDSVFFAGWVEDMNEFYGALDINTLTSLSETFPYAITEGARAGLATVSTNVGGVPKLVENGQTGILISPGDADALTSALVSLAEDPALRAQLGQALYNKASAEFSTESTCRTQIKIYETILKREEENRTHSKHGVLICGAYGHGNAGDEAILEAIITEIKSLDEYIPITVLSRKPKETRLQRGVQAVYRFNIPAIHREMKTAKLYINGGGSLIQDVTSRRSLDYYLYTIKWAKKHGCSVYMYGCGIGPVMYKSDIKLAQKIINQYVDIITVREPHSLRELSRFGIDRPEKILTSDPAICLKPSGKWEIDHFMQENNIPVDGKYLCISLRRWPGFDNCVEEIRSAIRYAYETHGLTPVFLAINRNEDPRAAEKIIESMPDVPYHIVSSPMDSHLTIGFISRMQVMISMRLHGLIFAASQGVPVIGISYDPKVSAFTEYIGSGPCIKLEEVTAKQLISSIDTAVGENGSLNDRLERAEKLKEIEKGNVTVAEELLR